MAFPTDDVVVYDDRIPESSIKDINEDVLRKICVRREIRRFLNCRLNFHVLGTFFFAVLIFILSMN